ncbi:MAG: asparagine synthetase B family protein [Phycisphaerales bacterium]
MCGIGGILRIWPADQRELALRTPHARSIPGNWLDILDESIKHRGPDGHGRFRDRAVRTDGSVVDVALVHRRLSIIDHAGGAQPMIHDQRGAGLWPADKREAWNTHLSEPPEALTPSPTHDRLALVFNGCIYNHRELRAELQRAGHVFTTDHSDTEVLVHGWREWGHRLPERLEGMFSWVIWQHQLAGWSMATDLAGEKPLYLMVPTGRAEVRAFCSGVPGLLRLARALDPSARCRMREEFGGVRGWLAYGSDTAAFDCGEFRIHQLEPRERCWRYRVDREFGTSQDSWTTLPTRGSGPRPTVADIDRLLCDSVAARIDADVPVACFLSSGLDSALIARCAHALSPDLLTLTVRMPHADYDESAGAAATAASIGVRHRIIDADPRPAEDLLRLIPQIGLPFGDSSLLPSLWVSRAARNECRVALSGDGADELLCGYERYLAAGWLRRWHRLLAAVPTRLLRSTNPRSAASKFARLAFAAGNGGYLDLLAVFPAADLRELTGRADGSTVRTLESAPDAPTFDFLTYLPYDLLRKTDSASMSVGLEVRSPFLSSELVRSCLAAPLDALMPRGRDGGRKGLLRQVARRYFPSEIVDRPKMGFAIPIGEWLRTDYGSVGGGGGLRTMLLDHLNSAEPFGPPSLGIELNMNFIRRMLDEHLGTGPSGLVKRDHAQRLYMLLVLSIWAKWVTNK